jgi:hypothetical protein
MSPIRPSTPLDQEDPSIPGMKCDRSAAEGPEGVVVEDGVTGIGAFWDTQDGQAELRLMGCEPAVFTGRLCDLPGCAASTYPSLSYAHLLPPTDQRRES